MDDWYHAIDLDTYLITDYPEVVELGNHLFQEIMEKHKDDIKTKREEYKSKEILKLILINLFIGYQCELPIKYSRRKSSYSKNGRYSQIFFQYDRVLRTIDTLIELGLIEQKIGRHIAEKDLGLETRMSAASKLIELFHKYHFHGLNLKRLPPKNLIQLRGPFPIKHTQSVERMWRNLERYNEFIENQTIEVRLGDDFKVSLEGLNQRKYEVSNGSIQITKFITIQNEHIYIIGKEKIQGYRLNGKEYFLHNDKISGRAKNLLIKKNVNMSNINKYYINYINHIRTNNNKQNNNTHNTTNTQHDTSMTGTYSEISEDNQAVNIWKRPRYNNCKPELVKKSLSEHGIIALNFKSNYQYLHRVFNRYIEEGGRMHGALHISLPKKMRRHIFINDSPTVELDFQGHHIRILYHKEVGVHYTKDPYELLCQDRPDWRPIYKIVLLVSINAEDEDKCLGGCRKKLLQKNYSGEFLTNEFLKLRIEEIKNAHPDIVKYINAGVGLELQNYEGRIVDMIINTLLREEIACLPVHDSFIVPAEHEKLLYEVMINSYQKVIGDYEPIIEKVE